MRSPDPELRYALAVLLVAALLSSGVLVLVPRLRPVSPRPTSTTNFANLTYASEDVSVPFDGMTWAGVTSETFAGVNFRLWADTSPNPPYELQGTGTEPNGIDLSYVVFANNSGFGGGPSNASVQTWICPDGAFGVRWLGFVNDTVDARLYVANPAVRYDTKVVMLTIPSSLGGSSPPVTTLFDGVLFTTGIANWFSPGGPSINASATLTTGAKADLSMWDGPLVACSVSGGAPSSVLGNATCLESAGLGHSVALVWDGYETATLLVRA
jgi:hypothetical protein